MVDERPYYALFLAIVNEKFSCNRAVRYMGMSPGNPKNEEKERVHKNARIIGRG